MKVSEVVKHTPLPWAWLEIGGALTLASLTDMQPYVLNVGQGALSSDDRPVLRMRDAERDLMVKATADHPDAEFIVTAVNLHERLVGMVVDLIERADAINETTGDLDAAPFPISLIAAAEQLLKEARGDA